MKGCTPTPGVVTFRRWSSRKPSGKAGSRSLRQQHGTGDQVPTKPGRSNRADAVAPAETIDPIQLTIDSRRTTYLIENARALYGLCRPDEEVIALLVQARSGRGRMHP
jgi:hypothetical protein